MVQIKPHGERLILFIPEAFLNDETWCPVSVTRETAQDLFGLLGKVLQEPQAPEQSQQERIWK